jgi:hypothetical protein
VVSRMEGHCGIGEYGYTMGLTHVVTMADTPLGPWRRAPSAVAVWGDVNDIAQTYTGNPGATRDPVSGLYLIYHQGCGPSHPKYPAGKRGWNCSWSTGTRPTESPTARQVQPQRAQSVPTCAADGGDPISVLSASSPLGPWTSHGSVYNHSSVSWHKHASNAVPAILPNGTAFLMFRSHTDERLGLLRADTWRGPFVDWLSRPLILESNE